MGDKAKAGNHNKNKASTVIDGIGGIGGIGGMMKRIRSRIVGEISKLRVQTGKLHDVYKLDSSRVDPKLARELYNNENDSYKLGAGFAKPVINTAVGFMGVPHFRNEDPQAQEALDDFFGVNVSKAQQVHRDAMRDGDCWVWLTYEENPESRLLYPESKGMVFVLNIIPPEQIHHINRDPFTGRPTEYILQSEHEWYDENGQTKKFKLEQRISAEARKIKIVEGEVPANLGDSLGIQFDENRSYEEPNKWGFLPIVQFSNERDSSAANGRSDLEVIEPFMKAYHDVMIQALQNHKIHSIPRLKMKLKDVRSFLENNFGIKDPVEYAKEGKTIKLEGKELLLFMDGEDADYIEIKSPIESTEVLLKFLFYCIVDASETPEFAFGVHTPSSHASVEEQMPVLIRRVARKREQFTESWQMLARMFLAMKARAEGKGYTNYATELIWDEIDPRDDKDVAEALLKFAQAMALAVESSLISEEAAVKFLAQYVDTMSDYISDDEETPGEREKIIRDRIRRARLEDAALAEKEKDLIDKTLEELEKTKREKAR